MIEVEIKIPTPDNHVLTKQLADLGFVPFLRVRETDTYYNHVGYDIRKNDKALRIRRTENADDGTVHSFLTYKGPKLDTVSMTREEIELPITDPKAFGRILTGTGFVAMIPVDKIRFYMGKEDIHACVDEVTGLGTFLELEILVENETGREEALGRIDSILAALGLSPEDTTRISYLTMLQKKEEEDSL